MADGKCGHTFTEVELELRREVDQLSFTSEHQQSQITELVGITKAQSEMLSQMCNQLQPILRVHASQEELKKRAREKIVTGAFWGVIVGIAMLVWQGIKVYIKGD